MLRSCSCKMLLGAALLGGSMLLHGCQPTPDYRVALYDIPSDAAMLLFGWKAEDDTVGKTSLAVPIVELSAEQRLRYVFGLDLGEVAQESGVLSVATVNSEGCMTSVLSAPNLPRSGSARVTQIELSLDPRQNPDVVPRALVQNPPIQCVPPPPPPLPPYPEQVACQKIPGLVGIPKEPTLVPTRPVVINTLRQLRGQARVFDGGKLSFYGWGFDHASVSFGPVCDPTSCFVRLGMDYPQYALQLAVPMIFKYPTVTTPSFSQIDLPVTKIKSALNVDPASNFQDRVVLCVATSAISFKLTNADGAEVIFAEPLPKM
jgi:hypothetical protein